MKKYDLIVIGSGISGLSFAHYANRDGMKVLVLERELRTGGAFHSHLFGKGSDSFWLELGAHTCYNSYSNFIKIIESLNLTNLMLEREKVPFRMLEGLQVKSIPSQINFWEMLPGIPRYFLMSKKGKTVESFYSAIVGKNNFERIFYHVFNAVPSQDARKFPAEILFKKRSKRKDILNKFTFQNGLQTVTNALAMARSLEVKIKCDVISVTMKNKIFKVTVKGGKFFESEALALAVPPDVAARLLKKMNPELASQLSAIQVTKVDSMGVRVLKSKLTMEPVASLIPLEDNFYSVVSRDTVFDPQFRGFTFHFKPGYLDKKGKLAKVSQVLGLFQRDLQGVAEKVNVVPSPVMGHMEVIQKIEGLLQGGPLCLTGNYFTGMAVEDCVTRSLLEYERLKKI
jgi:protoporphyrinogen oxidase